MNHIIFKFMTEIEPESQFLEYKKGFNPQALMHTICAFANDIDDIGTGYIVIGVEEKSGIPVFPIEGIRREDIDHILKNIITYIHKSIVPRILPKIEVVDYMQSKLILVTVEKGFSGPYKALIDAYASHKHYAYFIRKGSVTLKAEQDEFKALIRHFEDVPFDEQLNRYATSNDMSHHLILDYLKLIGSKKHDLSSDLPYKTLLNDLDIVAKNDEEKVKNIGILFFTKRPSLFIPYAYIDLTIIKDPTGHGMIEKRFDGPLHYQYDEVMRYIKSSIYEVKTLKQFGKWEAIKHENYPFSALEEIIANAILHKDYDIKEPIHIRITKDEIEVTSFPGFDQTISEEDIKRFNVRSRTYKNKRVAQMLKELNIVESKNTGYPTILKAIKDNNSQNPIIIMDRNREYVSVVIKIHESFLEKQESLFLKEDIFNYLRDHKKTNTKTRIISILKETPLGITDLSIVLGYEKVPGHLKQALKNLTEDQIIKQDDKKRYVLLH